MHPDAPPNVRFPFQRLHAWRILLTLITLLLVPGYGGDSQIYHLPNIANMLKSGSITGISPEHLYRPVAATAYYPRGFEAICALFFLLPLSTPLIILFKFSLFASFWMLLRRESRSIAVATGLITLLLSMDFIRHDLANLKNDVVMAIPLVFAGVMACTKNSPKHGIWYDATALIVKPENALALWAQAARDFNLAALFAWLLTAALLCLLAVRGRRHWPAVALVLIAIGIQQVGYPKSLAYTMRFKQVGQTSEVFAFFAQRGITSADRIAIHSADESSFSWLA